MREPLTKVFRRAGCGKSARPVRRGDGGPQFICYPPSYSTGPPPSPKWLRFTNTAHPPNQKTEKSENLSRPHHSDRTNLHKPAPRLAAFPKEIPESVTSSEISEVIGVHRCLSAALHPIQNGFVSPNRPSAKPKNQKIIESVTFKAPSRPLFPFIRVHLRPPNNL